MLKYLHNSTVCLLLCITTNPAGRFHTTMCHKNLPRVRPFFTLHCCEVGILASYMDFVLLPATNDPLIHKIKFTMFTLYGSETYFVCSSLCEPFDCYIHMWGIIYFVRMILSSLKNTLLGKHLVVQGIGNLFNSILWQYHATFAFTNSFRGSHFILSLWGFFKTDHSVSVTLFFS